MKLLGLIAAGLLGAMAAAPMPAAAAAIAPAGATLAVAGVAGAGQVVVVRERSTVRRNSRYRGNRYGTRQVCTNRYRHGRRIRTCRSVRYRR